MVYPLLGMPQGAEWIVILAIVILVFGAAKLPALAKSSGQALRIFKTETKGLMDDDEDQQPERPGETRATRELPTSERAATDPAESSETRTDRHPG